MTRTSGRIEQVKNPHDRRELASFITLEACQGMNILRSREEMLPKHFGKLSFSSHLSRHCAAYTSTYSFQGRRAFHSSSRDWCTSMTVLRVLPWASFFSIACLLQPAVGFCSNVGLQRAEPFSNRLQDHREAATTTAIARDTRHSSRSRSNRGLERGVGELHAALEVEEVQSLEPGCVLVAGSDTYGHMTFKVTSTRPTMCTTIRRVRRGTWCIHDSIHTRDTRGAYTYSYGMICT